MTWAFCVDDWRTRRQSRRENTGYGNLCRSDFLVSNSHVDFNLFISFFFKKKWKQGNPVDISDIEAEERRQSVRSTSWFERIDKKYMIPFFRRVLTTQDLREARIELQQLRTNWYSALPHDAEELAQLEEMDHLRDRRNEDGGGSETTGEELTTVVDEMSPAPRRSSSEPIRKRADD